MIGRPFDDATSHRQYVWVVTTHFHLRHIPMVLVAGIQPLRMSWVPWFAFFWLQCFRPIDVSLLVVAHGFVRLVRRGGQLHYRGGLYPSKDGRFSQVKRCYISYARRVNAYTCPVCSKRRSVTSGVSWACMSSLEGSIMYWSKGGVSRASIGIYVGHLRSSCLKCVT